VTVTHTQAKLVLGATRDVPFNKLVLSQANVRRVKAGVSLDELANDIARRGLLAALCVRPVLDREGAETDKYEVPAGGRRYRAIERLVKAKRLARTVPVPCIVKAADTEITAEDDSLAENIHREALHPLDQFRAFQRLAEQGQSETEIAANWFVTPAIVRQRLRLAAVSPKLLDLYVEDAMTLEQLMAFTVTDDHARQEQVWDRLAGAWNKEAYTIRRLLTEGTVSARDRRALYVGLAAYEAAGGVVLRDLFTADGGGWLQDPLLLERLATEKLQEEAASIAGEGWRWVETATDFPYGHIYGLRRIAPIGSGLSAEEEARGETLRAELEAIEAEHADSPDDLPAEVDRRLGAIETELDALERRPACYDPEDIARAGVFVSIGNDGLARIERGFVKPEDEPGAQRPDGHDASDEGAEAADTRPPADSAAGDDASDDEEAPRPLPERLVAELSAYRTLALRDAVAQVPEIALTLLLFKLVRDLFGSTLGSGSCLDITARPAFPGAQPPDLKESASALSLEARHTGWADALPVEDDQALWDALATMDGAQRMALLAHCIGASVNALWEKVNPYGGGLSATELDRRRCEANRLASAVQLDMAAAGWRPTVDNYLGRTTKSRILDAVREARGEMAAQLIDHLKKPDMAREAERLLADSGWVPEALRLAGAETTAPDMPVPQADNAAALPAFLEDADDSGTEPLSIAAE
jgi:ParB family chromosome partitioning protein